MTKNNGVYALIAFAMVNSIFSYLLFSKANTTVNFAVSNVIRQVLFIGLSFHAYLYPYKTNFSYKINSLGDLFKPTSTNYSKNNVKLSRVLAQLAGITGMFISIALYFG